MEYVIQQEARKVLEKELLKARQQRQKQVRQQSIQWSEETRRKFDKEKENQIKQMTESLTREAEEHAQARIEHLLMTHDLAMAEVGTAHRAAAQLREAEKGKELKRLQNDEMARQRGRAAMGKTKLEQETKSQTLFQALKRKEEVRKEEDRKVKEMIQQRKPLSVISNITQPDKSKTALGFPKKYEQNIAGKLRVPPKTPTEEKPKVPPSKAKGIPKSQIVTSVPSVPQGRFGKEAKLRINGVTSPEEHSSVTMKSKSKFTSAITSHPTGKIKVPGKTPKSPKKSRNAPVAKLATVRYFDSSVPKPEVEYIPPKGLGEREEPRESSNAWDQARILSQTSMKEIEEKAKQQEEMLRRATERGNKAEKKAKLEKQLVAAKSELMAGHESFERLGSGQQIGGLGLEDSSEGEKRSKKPKGHKQKKAKYLANQESDEFLEITSEGEFDSSPEETLKTYRVKDSKKQSHGVSLVEVSPKEKRVGPPKPLHPLKSQTTAAEAVQSIDSEILKLQQRLKEQESRKVSALLPDKSPKKPVTPTKGKQGGTSSVKKRKKAKKKGKPDHSTMETISSGEIPTVLSRKQYTEGKSADDEFLEMSSDDDFEASPETTPIPPQDVAKVGRASKDSSVAESTKTKKKDAPTARSPKSKKIATDVIDYIDSHLLKLQDGTNKQTETATAAKKSSGANNDKPTDTAKGNQTSSASTMAEARMKTHFHSSGVEDSSISASGTSGSVPNPKAKQQKKLTKKLPKKTVVETDTSKSEISSNSIAPNTPEGPYTSTPDGKMKLKPSSDELRQRPSKKDLVLHHYVSEFLLRRQESIAKLAVSSSSSSDLKVDSTVASSSDLSSFISPKNRSDRRTSTSTETWETILEERTILEESITENSKVPIVSSGSTIAETNVKAYSPSLSGRSGRTSDSLPEDELDGSENLTESSLIRKLGVLSEHHELNIQKNKLEKELQKAKAKNDDVTSSSVGKTGSSDPTKETTDYDIQSGESDTETFTGLQDLSSRLQGGLDVPPEDSSNLSSAKTSSGAEKEVKRIHEFISDLSDCSTIWKQPPTHESINHDGMMAAAAAIFEQLKYEYAIMTNDTIERPPTAP